MKEYYIAYDRYNCRFEIGTLTDEERDALIQACDLADNTEFQLYEKRVNTLAETIKHTLAVENWTEIESQGGGLSFLYGMRETAEHVLTLIRSARNDNQTLPINILPPSNTPPQPHERNLSETMKYITLVFANSEIEQNIDNAEAAFCIGELTDEQFSVFEKNFRKQYKGMYCVVFVSENSITTTADQVTLKMLLNKTNLSGGRQKALSTSIRIANEVRTFYDCKSQNVEDPSVKTAEENAAQEEANMSAFQMNCQMMYQIQAAHGRGNRSVIVPEENVPIEPANEPADVKVINEVSLTDETINKMALASWHVAARVQEPQDELSIEKAYRLKTDPTRNLTLQQIVREAFPGINADDPTEIDRIRKQIDRYEKSINDRKPAKSSKKTKT